jgi:hypothetical protein
MALSATWGRGPLAQRSPGWAETWCARGWAEAHTHRTADAVVDEVHAKAHPPAARSQRRKEQVQIL